MAHGTKVVVYNMQLITIGSLYCFILFCELSPKKIMRATVKTEKITRL